MTPNATTNDGESKLLAAERWVLLAAVLASSMAFIDSTALNVALPALQADLGASGTELLWILNIYALFVTALLLVAGSLGDRFGRKRVYMLGITLFCAASVWCGFAPTTNTLIVARSVQGLGGALMIPGSLAMIGAAVDPKRRGRAIGTWSAFSVIATAVGPVLGGLFARAGLWRGVFFINVPVAVAALAVLWTKTHEARDASNSSQIDIWGAVLATCGLLGVNYALIEATTSNWSEPRILVSLLAGLIALAVFVVVEARCRRPLLPLQVFKVPMVQIAVIVTLAFYSSLYGILFLFSLNLIQVQKYDAALAGLTQLPLMLLLIGLARWSGVWVDRHGARLPLTVGPAIAGLGFLCLAIPGVTAGPSDFWMSYLPALILLGLAMGITVTPLSTAVMSSIAPEQAGLASGINSTLGRLSSVLAVAVFGSLALFWFSRSLSSRIATSTFAAESRRLLVAEAARLGDARIPDAMSPDEAAEARSAIKLAFVDAFRLVCLVCALIAWASAGVTALMMGRRTTEIG
jgi:EmrB/QacA subfamily drug resistance transporter